MEVRLTLPRSVRKCLLRAHLLAVSILIGSCMDRSINFRVYDPERIIERAETVVCGRVYSLKRTGNQLEAFIAPKCEGGGIYENLHEGWQDI